MSKETKPSKTLNDLVDILEDIRATTLDGYSHTIDIQTTDAFEAIIALTNCLTIITVTLKKLVEIHEND